jgi:Macro domain
VDGCIHRAATGTACRMQYAAWLRDWQRKNHKGISPALQICDSCSRPRWRWQASGTGASGILLSDIFEPGKRKWLSVGGLSADFLRHLRLSKRPGSEGCSRYHQCSWWKM